MQFNYKNYRIEPNGGSTCYVVHELRRKTDEQGEEKTTEKFLCYMSTLPTALSAIVKYAAPDALDETEKERLLAASAAIQNIEDNLESYNEADLPIEVCGSYVTDGKSDYPVEPAHSSHKRFAATLYYAALIVYRDAIMNADASVTLDDVVSFAESVKETLYANVNKNCETRPAKKASDNEKAGD